MTQVQILPPATKFLKKLKDKKLKSLYKEAIEMICEDYSIGEEKTGDLAGMYGYDIYIQNSLEKGSCFMIDIPEPSFHNTNNTLGSTII